MNPFLVNAGQASMLQELANTGLAQAGNAISRVWGSIVHLSVTDVTMVPASRLPALIPRLAGNVPLSATRQTFHGAVHGEALVLLTGTDRCRLELLVDPATGGERAAQGELLVESADLLASACLGGIGRELRAGILVGPPDVIGEHLPAGDVLPVAAARSGTALCIEVRLAVEQRSVRAHVVMQMADAEVERLALLLDACLHDAT